jgi:hypothetical protein
MNTKAAENSTNDLIVNPMKRLTRLSKKARACASNPAPGAVMIRRHGENNVRSKIFVENISANVLSRRLLLAITPFHPAVYHH